MSISELEEAKRITDDQKTECPYMPEYSGCESCTLRLDPSDCAELYEEWLDSL